MVREPTLPRFTPALVLLLSTAGVACTGDRTRIDPEVPDDFGSVEATDASSGSSGCDVADDGMGFLDDVMEPEDATNTASIFADEFVEPPPASNPLLDLIATVFGNQPSAGNGTDPAAANPLGDLLEDLLAGAGGAGQGGAGDGDGDGGNSNGKSDGGTSGGDPPTTAEEDALADFVAFLLALFAALFPPRPDSGDERALGAEWTVRFPSP